MKTCVACKKEKEYGEFALRSSAKQTRSSYCKPCQREYAKQHYADKPDYYIEKSTKARRRKADYIRLERSKPCADCGESYPFYMMEFDHRGNEVKEFNISQMCSSSWKMLKKEILKCDVVCANHHRERTHFRRIQADVA